MNLVVIAKAPVPGRSKTRLCPPCSPVEAAGLAEAALADTLHAVAGAGERLDARTVLVLEGSPGTWLPPGFHVVEQRAGGLDERLAAAFDDVGGPALLVGMDTPQLTSPQIADAVLRLGEPDVNGVLGEAVDGGWWAIGLRRPDARVFLGVPMSTSHTCEAQRARLAALELTVAELPVLRDVDTFDDALAVAAEAPATRFAAAMAGLALAKVEER
jgi:rSAM/selenodomain-associated transferase 1